MKNIKEQQKQRLLGIIIFLIIAFIGVMVFFRTAPVQRNAIPLHPDSPAAQAKTEGLTPLSIQPSENKPLTDSSLKDGELSNDLPTILKPENPIMKQKTALPAEASQTDQPLKTQHWAIQLGRFKDVGNAERLVNTLQAKGFKHLRIKHEADSSYEVLIRPETDSLVAAQKLLNRIGKQAHTQGFIIKETTEAGHLT